MFPRRKRLRIKGYDYSKDGFYFITTNLRSHRFGKIINGSMILNDLGKIVEQQWYWLGKQYSYLILHEFIIMPDHLHVILEIRAKNHHQKIKPLPEIMGAFKMTASKLIHLAGYPEFKWHRSYHAIIIRDTSALPRIAQYIRDNPKKWNY